VTFTNETASGWQRADFSEPYPIEPNTTYVASYHMEARPRPGPNQQPPQQCAATGEYFLQSGFDMPPLRAWREGEQGHGSNGVIGVDRDNGTYKYPDENWDYSSTNFWVDVVFQQDNTGGMMAPFAAGGGGGFAAGADPALGDLLLAALAPSSGTSPLGAPAADPGIVPPAVGVVGSPPDAVAPADVPRSAGALAQEQPQAWDAFWSQVGAGGV
jgi:hypothetical protein